MNNGLRIFFMSLCAGVLISSMTGCNDDESTRDSSIIFFALSDIECRYNFDEDKYLLDSQVDKSFGLMASSLNSSIEYLNDIDSNDLPDKSIGEFEYMEMKFVDDRTVNLINRSYTVDDDYNTSINWVLNCKVIGGSKLNFDKGENIELKLINQASRDSSYSVYLKACLAKSFHADPQKSKCIYDQFGDQIICNKNQISWKAKSIWISKSLFDSELIPVLMENKDS